MDCHFFEMRPLLTRLLAALCSTSAAPPGTRHPAVRGTRLLAALFATTTAAHAQRTDDQERLLVARATVSSQAEAARQERVVGGAVGMVVGAASITAGAFTLANEPTPVGGALVAGGALSLGLGVYSGLLARDPYEQLRLELGSSRANGASERLIRLDARWSSLARSARRKRLVLGTISSALGAGMLSAGVIYSALAPAGMDPTTHALYTRMLIGVGAAQAALGAVGLLIPSQIERGYSTFRSVHQLQLGVSPQQGGALLGVGGTF